jgi:predicted DNA binding protein
MVAIAEFELAADDFVLGRAFGGLEDVSVELERVVPTTGAVFPFVWVRGTTAERITDHLRTVGERSNVSLVDSVGQNHLLRYEMAPDEDGIVGVFGETDVTLLSATGEGAVWRFEVRSVDRGEVADFRRRCRERGVPVTLTRLQQLLPEDQHGERDLTDPQREALLLAYEMGYFAEPREVTLSDIAERLGISRQALAARLKRGYGELVRVALVER